jgi:hypothetical protein
VILPESRPEGSAAAVLSVRLEDRRVGPLSKAVRIAASVAVAAVSGGSGGDELLPGMDLVVTRRDTGAEVLRLSAGRPQEADRMLEATRRDLDRMTVEQFVRSWRVVED